MVFPGGDFTIGDEFIVELSFRTSQADGVLVATQSQNGRNALTLELNKGQVCRGDGKVQHLLLGTIKNNNDYSK